MPEEIRKKLVSLKLSKENFDQIKKELAFLPKEKQKDYLEELDMLYKKFIKE